MRRPNRLGSRLVPVALIIACSSVAHAEPTSWLSLGGGGGFERNYVTRRDDGNPIFTGALGVGTTSRSPLVLGGVFRTVWAIGLGADIGLAARLATRGYARGGWGAALDVGAVGRFWQRGEYGTWPLQGVVTVGAPWGLGAAVGVQAFDLGGGPTTGLRGGFLALEIDLLRLTIMRGGGTNDAWRNPYPVESPSASTP